MSDAKPRYKKILLKMSGEVLMGDALFGIDPTTTGLASGEVPLAEALNSADTIGYTGPCPPSGTHAYLIELYAISQQIEYTRGDPAADVIAAIQAASLAQSSVIGTYTST